MDSNHHVGFGDRWYATWFITVMEIFPHEFGSPEEWLRSP
jgi:hypothetical protein